MRDHRSRRRAAIVYFAWDQLGTLIAITQGILLTPMYLRTMSVSLYGGWLAIGNVLGWITLVDPGIGDILRQRVAFHHGRGSGEAVGATIGTGLLIGVVVAFLPLVALPFGDRAAHLVGVQGGEVAQLAAAYRLGVWSTVVTLFSFVVAAIAFGLQLSGSAGFVYTVSGAISIVVTMLLSFAGWGVSAIPAGMLARGAFLLVGNSVIVARWSSEHLAGSLRVARSEARELRGVLSVYYVARLGASLTSYVDSFLIAAFISPQTAAVYTITERAFTLARMPAERLVSVLVPGLSHLIGEGRHDRFRETVAMSHYIAITSLFVFIGAVVALNEVFVTLWVGPAFYGGMRMSALIAVASLFGAMTTVWYRTLFAAGQIKGPALVLMTEGGVKVGVQAALLGAGLGALGVPVAAIVARATVAGPAYAWLASRTTQTTTSKQFWLYAGHLAVGGAGIAVGVCVALIVRHASARWSWVRFAAASVVVAAVLLAILLVTDRRSRDLARRGIESLHVRFARG